MSEKDDTYCCCNGKDEGAMVACDNAHCPRQWFHFESVGLKCKSRGKWYCCAVCRHAETKFLFHSIEIDSITLGHKLINAAQFCQQVMFHFQHCISVLKLEALT